MQKKYLLLLLNFCSFLTSIWQTGKSTFVEHRTFLHLYRSFHRLWIFLALMFQVTVVLLSYLLCLFWVELVHSYENRCLFSHSLQVLTIIAFNNGHIDLDTFKIILSIGPSFAIMNFIESILFEFAELCDHFSQNAKFHLLYTCLLSVHWVMCCLHRLFRCLAYVWGLLHCKRHGYLKAGY